MWRGRQTRKFSIAILKPLEDQLSLHIEVQKCSERSNYTPDAFKTSLLATVFILEAYEHLSFCSSIEDNLLFPSIVFEAPV